MAYTGTCMLTGEDFAIYQMNDEHTDARMDE